MKGVTNVGNKLSALFDFQKFDGNASLQRVIDSVHSRHAVQELSLDEMSSVNAAGTAVMVSDKKDTEKGKK